MATVKSAEIMKFEFLATLMCLIVILHKHKGY